jgi:hypothetical protein
MVCEVISVGMAEFASLALVGREAELVDSKTSMSVDFHEVIVYKKLIL